MLFSKEESDIDFVMSIVQILKGSSFVKILTELQKGHLVHHQNLPVDLAKSAVHLCSECFELLPLEARQSAVIDLFSYAVSIAFDDSTHMWHPSDDLKRIFEEFLDCIPRTFLAFVNTSRDINPYLFILLPLRPELKQLVSAQQLKSFLTNASSSQFSMHELFKAHHSWTFVRAPKFLRDTFTEMLCSFSAASAFDLLKNAFRSDKVTWSAVLTLTSTCLVCYPEAQSLLTGYISECVTRGLEFQDADTLLLGLLLARHACAEGPHIFPSYCSWFQTEFGQATSSSSTKSAFSFLMKILTDLVPYESAQALKAHIQKPPFVPVKCKPYLSDYIALARSRLLELGELFEDSSIFGDNQQHAAGEFGSTVEHDVNCAVELFAKSGRVPTSVMEASIFKKPYFVGKFLPHLLTARPLPDEPDTKMKFIAALHRAGKVPQAMLTSYENKCKQQCQQLINGIFPENEDNDLELFEL